MYRSKGLKVAFLTRYDRSRASSRARVYAYLPYLKKLGLECRVLPFPAQLSLQKKWSYLFESVRLARWADVVVLQKLLLRKPFLGMIANFKSAVVFDFDDALHVPVDALKKNESVAKRYRALTKRLHHTLRTVRCVIAGSSYLADFARQFQSRVYTLPSSVDTKDYPIKRKEATDSAVLGWIGSPENLKDFESIRGALQTVFRQPTFSGVVKVVSAHPFSLDGVPAQFEAWSLERESELLRSFDIGLMPLNDTERSRGRCAFKAIQYMAAGLPVIASPVGAALEVVEHEKTGLVCASETEWLDAINLLARDADLRQRLGMEGRARVEKYYSIQSNAPLMAQILEEAGG